MTNDDETYDELVGKNLQNDDDADRFDEAFMGVKKQFRPDWLNHENKMFINKLNFVCKNYDQTYKSVSYFLVVRNGYFSHESIFFHRWKIWSLQFTSNIA